MVAQILTPGPWIELKSAAAPPAAGRWMRRHPSEIDDTVKERAGAMPRPLGETELAELRAAHERWGADDASMAAIGRLGRPTARVIVTGQQPGLMAGPLLVLYKTLGAVGLARRLEQAHPGLDFVPVFWVASEDHDYNEVRRAYWPGASGVEEFLLPTTNWRAGEMVGPLAIRNVVATLRAEIERTTLPSEFRDEVLALLAEAYEAPGTTLESGFCRILLRLMRGLGLVIVSPLMEWVRRRGAAVLARELDRPGWSSAEVRARGERLRAAGHEPALHRSGDEVNAFWIDAESRRFALRAEDGAIARRLAGPTDEPLAEAPLTAAEAGAALAEDPLRWATNVVTRPMVQDSALPTVAQVVGPGEAAYLAQVEAVYDDFGVFAPVRWPRPEAVLLEPRVARHLEKQGVALDEALELDGERLLERVLRRGLEGGVVAELEALQRGQREELDQLRDRLAARSPAIDGAFDKLAQAMEKGYRVIEERILSQRSQDEMQVQRALAVVSASLRPAGLPQERRLNPLVPFGVHYGLDWAQALASRLALEHDAERQVIVMSQLEG